MSDFPQLRVRTEFSFRNAFGPIKRVAARVDAMGASHAGIVDVGTWGHVRWSKASTGHTVPLYGREVPVKVDGKGQGTAWVLATNLERFYHFSTSLEHNPDDALALLAEYADGLLRFPGTHVAFDSFDASNFDAVDMNPGMGAAAKHALAAAKKSKLGIVVTSDNFYPSPEDSDAFGILVGDNRMTPQWIMSEDELNEAMSRWLSPAAWKKAVALTKEFAHKASGLKLAKAPIIQVEGDLRAMAEEGRQKRLALGHLQDWPQLYEDRLQHELLQIENKKFESYFIVVSDLIAWAKERMLVGPGRGSSAGSLLCYCLGITEVDPIPHGLLFERFIDTTRDDLPDIDIDFDDRKRDEVFVYLADKYGEDNVARIGNINTLKPRSVMAKACQKLGVPDKDRFDVLNVLIEYSSGDSRYGHGLEDTFANTDLGRKFVQKYPEIDIVQQLENHASHTGVHAAGVIVCNVPVSGFCTIGDDGVAQIDKPDSEALNLLKIDALGLRTLGIISDAGVTTADELYSLKLDDPKVLRIFDDKKFCGIFQFEGHAQRSVSAQVQADTFRTLDHVTALARPGPLGGGAANKYIDRKAGREEVVYAHKALEPVLHDTYGVVLYQEQVMRIVREIGKFSWADTTVIRKAMSGRKGEEFFNKQGEKFIAGAAQDGINAELAAAIWKEICSFGAWGMNKSHTCAYAVISYWCAWMKAYHPLEYAAACLRSAKDDDQTMAILREMAGEGVAYIAFDKELSEQHWSVQDGKLVGGFQNLVGFGPAKARMCIEARKAGGLTAKQEENIAKATVKFSELYPIRTQWAELHANPEAFGCSAGSYVAEIANMPEEGNVLLVGRVVKKQQRDENEAQRVGKRNGKKMSGQTLFADLFLSDDSGGPVTVRIDRFNYEPLGRIALSNLVVGQDVIMVRGKRIPNFNMVKAFRIRCLTNPDAMKEQ